MDAALDRADVWDAPDPDTGICIATVIAGVSERAATGDRRDWLEWARDGDLETADAGEHVEPRHHVRVEREGTLVELSGPDPLLLHDLARALAPAPTEAPRLSP